MPFCIQQMNNAQIVYLKFFNNYLVSCFNVFPTLFMALAYYKIGQVLVKQNKCMKRVCSNAVRSRYVKNRRTFLACFVIVLCYGVCVEPSSVFTIIYIVHEQYFPYWVRYQAFILRVAGSNALNSLLYGMFDKKLMAFWKFCSIKK